jgi:dihydrofolate reductase
MAKVLWHVSASLDGFIAGPGNTMDWMSGVSGPNPVIPDVMSKIGAILMGARTYYDVAGDPNGKPYGGAITPPVFVATSTDPATARPGHTFVSGSAAEVLAPAKAAAGENYVAILGAETAKRCLAEGELDEILVHVAPRLLGDGIRMFDAPGSPYVRLEPISLTTTETVANMWYRVPRN